MTIRPGKIRNVVFDVGNVIVRWEPEAIVELAFGKDLPDGITSRDLFGGDIFRALNRGAMSLTETQRIDAVASRLQPAHQRGRFLDQVEAFEPVSYTHLTLPTKA